MMAIVDQLLFAIQCACRYVSQQIYLYSLKISYSQITKWRHLDSTDKELIFFIKIKVSGTELSQMHIPSVCMSPLCIVLNINCFVVHRSLLGFLLPVYDIASCIRLKCDICHIFTPYLYLSTKVL